MKQKPKDYKEKQTNTQNGQNMKRSKQILIYSFKFIYIKTLLDIGRPVQANLSRV